MGRRMHDEYWSKVTKENGLLICKRCGFKFKGGASRIRAHVERIQGQGITVCSSDRDSSTDPQEAANVMNSVDVSAGGQEMIYANASALVARHINITEPTGLFEGMHFSHHIEGEMASHSSLKALQSKFLKRNAKEMRVILESQSPEASGSSTPTSEDAKQPDSKKQKIEIATASPEKGKSPLGRGSTSSPDVDVLELEEETGDVIPPRKKEKAAALFSDDFPFLAFIDKHLFSEGTRHQIQNSILQKQLQWGQHSLLQVVALLRRSEDLALDLAKATKEKDDLRSELEAEKAHLENIKESMNEYISENKDLRSRAETAEKESDELKLKLAALQNEKDSLASSADTGSSPLSDDTFDDINESRWEAASDNFNLLKYPSYEIDWGSL